LFTKKLSYRQQSEWYSTCKRRAISLSWADVTASCHSMHRLWWWRVLVVARWFRST